MPLSEVLVHLEDCSHVYFCLCAQDATALLFLGQCFESGFGVQQNLRTAIEYYKRAARAGNKQAKSLLTPPNDTDSKGKHTRSVGKIHICISHCILHK